MNRTPSAAELLNDILGCQNVGPPYRGWGLVKLRRVFDRIKNLGYVFDDDVDFSDRNMEFIAKFMKGRVTRGWDITYLCKVANEVREYRDLPSVDELNPDIGRMRAAAKKNGLGEILDRFK